MKLKKITAALLSAAIALTAGAMPAKNALPGTQTELYASAADAYYVYEYDNVHTYVFGDFKYRIAYKVDTIITDNGEKKEVKTPEFVFLTDYKGEDPNVVIPSEIEGMPVGEIYDAMFSSNLTIESVVIPDSVRTIGMDAFNQCGALADIQLGNGVEVFGGINTFFSCDALEKIVIPDSVKTLSRGMFTQCDKLSDVTIGKGVKTIAENAFRSCGAIKSIVIPENVEKIDSGAFSDCYGLESIVIENPDCEIYDSYDTICHSGTYDTFEGTIYGHEGSTAQAHAEKYNKNFALIEDIPPVTEPVTTAITTTTTKAATTTTKATTTTTKSTTTTTKATTTTTKSTTTTTKATTTTTKATTTTTKATTTTTKATTTTTKATTATTKATTTTTKATTTTTKATTTTTKATTAAETHTIAEPPPLISYDSDVWWSGEITLDKNTTIEGNLVLGRREVTVNGTVTENINFSHLDLNGYTLTVKGNIIHNHGTVDIGKGTLIVEGDYSMQNADITLESGGIAKEYTFLPCSAMLYMDKGTFDVRGNFYTHHLWNEVQGVVRLRNGTMKLGGNLWTDGDFCPQYSSLIETTDTKLVLTGSKDVSIYGTTNDIAPAPMSGQFVELEVENADKRIVSCGGHFHMARKLASDIRIKPVGALTVDKLDVAGYNAVINGDVTMNGITVSGGGSMTVNGNLTQRGIYCISTVAVFDIKDGTLNVNGSYLMETSAAETHSFEAYIDMRDKSGAVNISGDFTIRRSVIFGYDGVIRVGGNLIVDNAGLKSTMAVAEKHKIILNGKKSQTVKVDMGEYNSKVKLGTIELTRAFSNYTFDPSIEDCCECLVMSDRPDEPFIIKTKSDLNGDGKINTADIVALQKLLLGMDDNEKITTIVDLNNDGKMNVFDMIILKRIILNG